MQKQANIGVFILTILLACTNKSADTSNSDSTSLGLEVNAGNNQITCWGIGEIEFEDNFSDLEHKVGKNNITQDSLFLEGSFERLTTILWKGSNKELIIHWEEAQPPFKTIKLFEIKNPDSEYQFGNGIKIGTTLTKLATLNEKPISLYGFGWDYGGTFVGFNNGKLAGDIPCFGGVFELKAKSNSDLPTILVGDKKINSSNPAFKNYEAELKIIRISR